MTHIAPDIQFVGVDDDNLERFEGQFPLASGISYNSYVITDEKVAIMDAVDIRRTDEWLTLLREALGNRQPDYLIVQHMEPDHSGSIQAVMERYPGMVMVATAKALDMMKGFFEDFNIEGRTLVVGDNDTLSLGTKTLRFFTAPMVHWPEVMMTFDEADGVLFSADAFGSFSLSESSEAWPDEARRYYANIVGKYGNNVQAVLRKLKDTEIKVIASLHGPVLDRDIERYLSLYDKWSRYEPESEGILIAYASIYGGTAEAARQLGAKLRQRNQEVTLFDLTARDVSYAVAEAFRMGKIALCSVTYDAGLYPAMFEFIHHLAIKGLKNRCVGLMQNGSWAPAAGKIMTNMLSEMKEITIVEPMVTLRSRLHRADLPKLDELADAIVACNTSAK